MYGMQLVDEVRVLLRVPGANGTSVSPEPVLDFLGIHKSYDEHVVEASNPAYTLRLGSP
jgi:hypothetical protein